MKQRCFIAGFVFLISNLSYVLSSAISFCDGSEGKIEKPREQCSSGFNFGDTRPDCVCIKGIYRLWTDSCETADGFAEEVCTKLRDDTTKANIVGLKLTKDPVDWSQTGVVCERISFGTESWDLITENSRGASSTKNNNIYSMNGEAFIYSSRGKSTICVKPANLPANQKICKYLKQDNLAVWIDEEVDIEVKNDCEGTPLKSNSCFGTLQKKDSECQLQCQAKGRSMGQSQKPTKTNNNKNSKGRNVGKKKGQDKDKNKGSGNSNPPDVNLTNPGDYRKHDNKFLNRKMLIYNVISQIDDSSLFNKNNGTVVYGEPRRTFEIFNIMKNITQNFCPSEYVNPDWIELVIDMFYILHKGNVFRYEEPLSHEQFDWIKEILVKCQSSMEPITLTNQKVTDPGDDGTAPADTCPEGRATGYCNNTIVNGTETGACNFKPITLGPEHANASYHYVPDVAWDIVDLIQVACFAEFNASYRMFHVLEQAAEKLFTLQVKNLWYYPGWSKKTKTKLLGAAADLHMYNLEMCVESTYDRNGKIPRLVRPTSPKYIRRKRSPSTQVSSVGKNTQVYCSRSRNEFIYPQNCGSH